MIIAKEPCNECLFSKNRIVSKERAREIVAECAYTEKHFICHKGTIAGKDIACHGYYRWWMIYFWLPIVNRARRIYP